MTDLETYATIRDTAQNLRDLVETAAGGYHDELYLKVHGDENRVEVLAASNAQQVLSYCTYDDLSHVDGDAEAVIPTGLDSDTKGYLDYLSIAEGTNKVEVRFLGEEDPGGSHPRLASHWEAEGALSARIRLPSSEKDLNKVPMWLPARFTQDNRFLQADALDDDLNLQIEESDIDQYTPPTEIETTTSSVADGIIQPADFLDDVNYYPVVTEGDEFRVDLEGQEGDDSISGQVNAEEVNGPDVARMFDEGFQEVFASISGPVTLATVPHDPDDSDGATPPPLVVTQDTQSGQTLRHVLGAFVAS